MEVAGVDILDWTKGARKAVWRAGRCTRLVACVAHLSDLRSAVRYIVMVMCLRCVVEQEIALRSSTLSSLNFARRKSVHWPLPPSLVTCHLHVWITTVFNNYMVYTFSATDDI